MIKKNVDFSSVGFPQIIYFGDHEAGDEKIMIMEMLGPNLDKIFIAANLNFSIAKIRWIAKQLVGDVPFYIYFTHLTDPSRITSTIFFSVPDRSH